MSTRWKFFFSLIAVLALGGVFLASQSPAQAAGSVDIQFSCNQLSVTGTTDQYGVEARVIVRWSGFPGDTRAAGSTTANPDGSFQLFVPISPALSNPPPAPISPLDPDNQEQFLWVFGIDSNGNWTEDYFIGGRKCSGTFDAGDCLLPVPADSVGGSFVADAELYWAPGKLTAPVLSITAGNTATVVGVDESGEFYKIAWACQFLWVRVETLGPNFDEVWQGRALPTDIVN